MVQRSRSNGFPVMENMTVKTVGEYLERRKAVIVPVGVIEQHGYHLPLKTDALIATQLASQIGERSDVLVAPTIHQSFSGGNLPGTINISPAVMSLVVTDTFSSLASQGFRNFYLFLCHGGSGNARAVQDTLRMLLRSNPAFAQAMIVLLPIWQFSSQGMGWDRAIEEHDWHAGWLETSMVMALEPGLVRMHDLQLDPEPLLSQQIEHPDNYQRADKIVDDPLVVARMTQRPEITIAVMGHPERASRELGEQIIADIVENVSQKIMDLEARADGVYKQVAFTPEPLVLRSERH